MAVLRLLRADRLGAPEEIWRCADCGNPAPVREGWIVDIEGVAGSGTRRFLCPACTERQRESLAALDAPGGIVCHQCGRQCPSGEGAMIGHLDEQTREVFHVPLCLACADRELAGS